MQKIHRKSIPILCANPCFLYLTDTNSGFITAAWLNEIWPVDPVEQKQSGKGLGEDTPNSKKWVAQVELVDLQN